MRGIVKFWNVDKGFGFIRRERDTDVFVHVTAVHSDQVPQTGDVVEFETEPSKWGDGRIQARSVYLTGEKR